MNNNKFREWLNAEERATDYHPFMRCGHTAQAMDQYGYPVCVIDYGITPDALVVDNSPDLSGRMMRCYCNSSPKPSNKNEAFFEYRGPGSRAAMERCKNCGYSYSYHIIGERPIIAHKNGHTENCRHCDSFEPIGSYEFDSYYCGHAGWD